MRNNSFNPFNGDSNGPENSQVPVFVNFLDGQGHMHEFRPITLPAIPRKGEVIDGEWMGREECSQYEVVRFFHCVPTNYCKEPHLYLYLNRLDDCARPRDEDLRDEQRRGMEKLNSLEKLLRSLIDSASASSKSTGAT